MTHIKIEPITRLEGHGAIDIILNEGGDVARAYFQVPELRGFEKFCEGRPVEEMPRITNRICGVCPAAHHMAAAKASEKAQEVNSHLATLSQVGSLAIEDRAKWDAELVELRNAHKAAQRQHGALMSEQDALSRIPSYGRS